MGKVKLTITVSVAKEGYFVASDNVFYDYGIGDSLEECLLDYAKTIRERYEITKKHNHKYIQGDYSPLLKQGASWDKPQGL